MLHRHACQALGHVLLIALLSLPAFSQWEDVTSFKNVQIPFDLKIEDKIIEQGKVDIKVLKQTAQGLYYLRIQKKKEKFSLVSGETIPYVDFEEIPEKPNLRMRKNTAEKMLTILFESGTITWKYPNVKVRFKIEYIE